MCKQMNGRPSGGESQEPAAESCVPAKRVCTVQSRAQPAEDNAPGSGETIEGSSIEVVNELTLQNSAVRLN